jgi:hypothetical protein
MLRSLRSYVRHPARPIISSIPRVKDPWNNVLLVICHISHFPSTRAFVIFRVVTSLNERLCFPPVSDLAKLLSQSRWSPHHRKRSRPLEITYITTSALSLQKMEGYTSSSCMVFHHHPMTGAIRYKLLLLTEGLRHHSAGFARLWKDIKTLGRPGVQGERHGKRCH